MPASDPRPGLDDGRGDAPDSLGSGASPSGREASWAERGATGVVFLTLGLMVGAWAAALPGLKLKLALGTGELTLGLFVLAVGSVIASLVSGFALPRFGSGRATGVAALASVLVFCTMPLVASFVPFLIAAFGIGLSVGTLDVAVNGHAGAIEARWGSPIMSSFHGGFSLGGLIGSGLGGLVVWGGLGVEAQIWIPLALAGFGTLCAWPFLGTGQLGQAQGGGMTWPDRAMLGLCVVILFIFIIEGAVADWSAVYLSSVLGGSLAVAATGYAVFSIAMTAGRLGGDRALAALGPRLVVGAGGALAALGLAIVVAVDHPAAAIAGFGLVGIGASNIVPAVFSAATRRGPSPAAGIALVTSVGYAGFLSGPPLIGSIAAWSNLRLALACLVGAALVSSATGFMVFKRPAPS